MLGRAVYLLLLLLFLCLLFLRGFLLTRTEIPRFSTCHDFRPEGLECWTRPRYKRAILLLVDALRHDFTLHDPSSNTVDTSEPWRNRMQVFSELRRRHPDQTRHMEFIADPPSATFLRLKGLTTGGLPTFVDLGSNFGASEIAEDSWVRQLAERGKRLVFMGDDTWMGIYGRYFTRAFPFPSFDVWDLDTVDEGVWKHLLPQMASPDWDVLVGHFLGVDHAGHRYHLNHPALGAKLEQVNGWIGKVVERVDNETILFIFGDHGMTSSGDHGGETREEVTSTLFVYSGRPLAGGVGEERVYQTDLVPTLTLLLGVPTPFSSLGALIPSLFLSGGPSDELELQRAMRVNLDQVSRYIEAYSEQVAGEFSAADLAEIRTRVGEVKERYDPDTYSPETAKQIQETLRLIRDTCARQWARFDIPFMLLSLLLMIGAVAALLLGSPRISWVSFLPVLPALILSADSLSLWSGVTHPVTVVVMVGCAGYSLYPHSLSTLRWPKVDEVPSLALLILLCVGFTTNSFVLVEDYTVLFFSATLLSLNYLSLLREHGWNSRHALLTATALLSSRLSATFYGCREEQFWCERTWWLAEEQELRVRNYKFVAATASLALLQYGLYRYQRERGALGVGLVRFVSGVVGPVQVGVVSLYWALSSGSVRILSEETLCWLPRAVYLLGMASVVLIVVSPAVALVRHSPEGVVQVFGAMACYSGPLLAIYSALLPSLALLLRQGPSLVLPLLTTHLLASSHLLRPGYRLLALHLASLQFFFATGHQAAVQQFDWNAAFVGFTAHGSSHLIPVTMIMLRTLMSGVLVSLASPSLLLSPPEWEVNSPSSAHLPSSTALILGKCVWAALACTIHRRHLMIWNIFTPRLVLEMCLAVCSGVVGVVVSGVIGRTERLTRDYLDKNLKTS